MPAAALFDAFVNPRKRRRWLPAKVAVRSATPHKRMRLTWHDDTGVQVDFLPKGRDKAAVVITHRKLADRAAVAAAKQMSDHR